jgi:translocation protein SEC72
MADHTHAPGEEHSHSHGAETALPTPDPSAQAVLDQDFVAVPLALHPDPHTAVCAPHKLDRCDRCNVDFVNTNRLAKLLVANPGLLCPPPNNVVSQQLSQMVQRTKDEGNVRACLSFRVFC